MAITNQTLDLCSILSESKKIMNTHRCHFLALSVLFLLPLSFSIIAFPTLLHTLTISNTNHTQILLRYNDPHLVNINPFAFSLIFAITAFIVFICAIGTITYSVFHGFYGRPVNLTSAIKSLSNSFWRLFVTLICNQTITFGVSVLFILIVFLAVRGIEFLGFQVSSTCFSFGYGVLLFVFVYGFLNLQVKWGLACVVVVVESSWGLEPLRRSSYLVKEIRGVSFSLLMFFGFVTVLIVCAGWKLLGYLAIDWKSLAFLLNFVEISASVMLLLLYSLVANTLLYMHSKALDGELAGEIAQEYVSLPVDGEKVPHLVYVAQA